MNTSNETAEKAQAWLNENYPTKGDGYWSIEYIVGVAHGEHLDSTNRETVLLALAAVN